MKCASKNLRGCRGLVLAGMTVAGLASGPVSGQGEPMEPAGELPPEDPAAVVPGEAAGPGSAAGDKAEAAAAPADLPSETWESYTDIGPSNIAQEVTKGIRVEDIVEPPSEYRYAAFGKPDPFIPPIRQAAAGIDALEIPILSPLQRCALTAMRLVGIWQLPSGERKAMVIANCGGETGVGVTVRNGDPIGIRGGRVLGIGEDYLIVREFTLAPDGTRLYTDEQMQMQRGVADRRPAGGTIVFPPGKEPELREDQDRSRGTQGGGGAVPPAGEEDATQSVQPAGGAARTSGEPAAPGAAAPTNSKAGLPPPVASNQSPSGTVSPGAANSGTAGGPGMDGSPPAGIVPAGGPPEGLPYPPGGMTAPGM